MQGHPEASPRVRGMQTRAVAILLLIGGVNYLDRAALSVANPLIRHDLGLSISEMGFLLSAFLWAYSFSQLPAGLTVDRFGPRRLLGIALVAWSVAQGAAGFVGTLGQFAATRVLLGLGESPTFNSAVRVVREWHPVRHRSIPTAICCSAPASLGPLFAPPLLTFAMLAVGWRMMFVVLGAVGIIVAAVWYYAYRDVTDTKLDDAERRYLADGEEPTPAAPVQFADWRKLFRFRVTWGLLFGIPGVTFLSWLYVTWLPGYLEIQRHMSLSKTGIVAAIPYLFGLCGSFSGGWVSSRLIRRGVMPIDSCRIPIVVGLFGAAACTTLAAFATSDVLAVAAISGSVFCGSGASGMSWGMVSMAAPRNYTASLGSIMNFGAYFGAALAPIVTGVVVQATGSFVPALLTGAAIAAVAALIYLLVIPSHPIDLVDPIVSSSRGVAPAG